MGYVSRKSVRTEEEEEGGWIGSQDSISLGSMANGPWGDSAEALAYSRETGDTAGRHRNGSPGIEKRNASASLRVLIVGVWCSLRPPPQSSVLGPQP